MQNLSEEEAAARWTPRWRRLHEDVRRFGERKRGAAPTRCPSVWQKGSGISSKAEHVFSGVWSLRRSDGGGAADETDRMRVSKHWQVATLANRV